MVEYGCTIVMMRTPTFKPRPYKARGKMRWRIRIPGRFTVNGKDGQLYYDTLAEAEVDARELRRKFLNGELGNGKMLGSAGIEDASRAYAVLASAGVSGVTLEQLAREFADRYSSAGSGVSVDDLLVRYAAAVSGIRNWSAKYMRTWRQYSSKFAEEFGERTIGSLVPDEIRAWAEARFTSATYFNSALGVLSPCFSWAVQQKMLPENPFDRIERRRMVRSDAIDIFTPAEAARLLGTAAARDVAVPFALMLFAGIRPAEAARMEWSDIRRDPSGELAIMVRPSVAKTREVRLVTVRGPLAPLLETALASCPSGRIIPVSWNNISKAVRADAGLKNRHDAARHSFASYALAAGVPMAQVQDEMGHSRGSAMLFRHYRALATPSEAEEFWGILPPEVGLTAEGGGDEG